MAGLIFSSSQSGLSGTQDSGDKVPNLGGGGVRPRCGWGVFLHNWAGGVTPDPE